MKRLLLVVRNMALSVNLAVVSIITVLAGTWLAIVSWLFFVFVMAAIMLE